MDNKYLKLYLVTNISSKSLYQYERFISSAALGGITCVQLREKNMAFSELKLLALLLQSILKPLKIPLIINDHVELAKQINADGVHLGQSDMPPLEARRILGHDKIIGLSIESLQELETANQLTCINYIAASAAFPSKTKTNCKTQWGLKGLKQIAQTSYHPVIAIGGIHLNNVEKVIEQGAQGAAVTSAIHNDPDPGKISAIFIDKINRKLSQRKNYV